MNSKGILILYAPLGVGHEMAAKAIAETFALNYPEFEVKTADVLDFAFEIFRQGLPRVFVYVSSKIPFLYKWIYNSFNHQSRYNFLNRASDVFIKKSRFVEFIKEFNPDFILSTNPLPMHMVSLTKQKKIIDILSANVCTDFGFHSLWYNPDVNYYFVANEEIKNSLIGRGVGSEKIKITGIPVAQKYNQLPDRRKNLADLNFSSSCPVLLIVGGQLGFGELLDIVLGIKKENNKIQFIIVAGRDKKLQKKLETSELKNDSNVRVFNFVNNLQDYMAVSDLVLTKAGGSTVAECLVMGLPMIFSKVIPGQEEDNVKYLIARGAGFEDRNIKEAIKIIIDLFASPEKIVKMKENCKKIAKPNAAKNLAYFVAESLKNQNK